MLTDFILVQGTGSDPENVQNIGELTHKND